MFFLNFTVGEFAVFFAALAGLITVLYLLDRSKSKKVVSTLRFWTSDVVSSQQSSRRRMREPWSFLLQIISILLLLLAIGQLQWGSREPPSRKHVLLVDTSAWSSEVVNGGTLLDSEKKIALQYLARLPATDRVLVASVDAAAMPVTLFTSSHAELVKALEKLRSSYSALDMGRALSFARQAEVLSSGQAGEVVYIGPGRIQNGGNVLPTLSNLRTIMVPADGENCGIRSVGLRRDDQRLAFWQGTVTVENYGRRPHALQVTSRFPGRIVASRFLLLGPQETKTLEYGFAQANGGPLTTSIEPDDALRADDHVTLAVPASHRARLAVFTKRPSIVKPLIQSDPNIEASFFPPEQYTPHPAADIILLDQISPAEQPQIPAFWIAPPRDSSPVPVSEVAENVVVDGWNAANSLDTNLGGKNIRIKSAELFQATDDRDMVIANTAKGPVIVAHQGSGGSSRFVVLGFDPLNGELRFESTAPLLFANLLRWLCPESRLLSGLNASFVGEASVPLSSDEQRNMLSVSDEFGTPVPFQVHNQLLEFFTDRPTSMRVQFRGGTRMVSPVLANVAEDVWSPPYNAKTGLPQLRVIGSADIDLWKWLAFAGGLGLLADWVIFGRKYRIRLNDASAPVKQKNRQDRELVQR